MFNRLTVQSSQQSQPAPDSPPPHRPIRDFIDFVKTLIYAVVIVVLMRSFGFEAFNIPSGSMIPSLLVGDFLFVSKYTYGYSRYSVPLVKYVLPPPPEKSHNDNNPENATKKGENDYDRWMGSLPERGDIIVFKWPGDNSTDYIKRVIGLPGDQIEVRQGVVWLNNKPLPLQPVPGLDGRLIDQNSGRFAERYYETLPSGKKFTIQKYGNDRSNDNFPEQCPNNAAHCPVTVPYNHLFVMGDNRDNSADSRVSTALGGAGFVPTANIVGRAQILFFSLDEKSRWWEIWKWPFAVRWSRLMQSIQ